MGSLPKKAIYFGIGWRGGLKGQATSVAFGHPYEDAQKFITKSFCTRSQIFKVCVMSFCVAMDATVARRSIAHDQQEALVF